MDKLIQSLIQLSKDQPKGFTVDLNLNNVTEGFAVALFETQNSFGEDGLKKVVKIATEQNLKIGGWFSEKNQKFYWDAVKIINKKDEAVSYGKLNCQFAIYDLNNDEVIII